MSDPSTITITTGLDVHMPRPPNFLRALCSDHPVDVADVDDESLRVIGEAWAEALILHARKRRENRTEDQKGR